LASTGRKQKPSCVPFAAGVAQAQPVAASGTQLVFVCDRLEGQSNLGPGLPRNAGRATNLPR